MRKRQKEYQHSMRNIQALIDTDIVLDWLIYREPFGENGKYIMEQCIFGEVDDVTYIVRFVLHSSKEL